MSMNASKRIQSIKKLNTLQAYITEMTAYASAQPLFKCYRGQRNSRWENIPALFRPELAKLAENEKQAVRDLVSIHPREFSDDETMFDRLVRMQHFGLPSRLLDVSQNPLVALYFATDPGPPDQEADGAVTAFAIPEEREKYFDSDAVSCLANLANMTAEEKTEIAKLGTRQSAANKEEEIKRLNGETVYQRLHQFIRSEKPHFLPIIEPIDLFKPYYVHPKMSNRRILAQAGGFIIHGLLKSRGIRFRHQIKETKFIIPMGAKASLRASLELLGINDSTLFPELDRAANRIKATYSV
ncbi:FRG domain-containing protein [Cereibacter sphaeroides]|uniref:FRG domain-containing protein n=1 Tax=Cereibacter sphaeroides TaxID=1063 RepID=UPI000E5A3EAA|nr:FRG domain-containing protein [Cereibacter sphaeroides]RIA01518.1 FRG domain-containing protein [Cereibacter sphaeroides]